MNTKKWYIIKKFIPNFMYSHLLNSYYVLRSASYQGNKVYCTCCNKGYKAFYPDNGPFGECPGCGSSARHRLVSLYLERKTNFFKDNLRVLHIAPEHGTYKKFRKLGNLEYLSADLNSVRAKIKMDITNIQFEDNSIDVSLSSHVLEHIDDDKKAMKELYRIQKPSGWSIHQVPMDKRRKHTFEDKDINTDEERAKIYGHHDHKRVYGADYPKRLEEAGFKVICDGFAKSLSEHELLGFGINKEETIYLCIKEQAPG